MAYPMPEGAAKDARSIVMRRNLASFGLQQADQVSVAVRSIRHARESGADLG